jgi:glucose/arabinose dehydrogenase
MSNQKKGRPLALTAAILLVGSASAGAADIQAGKTAFRQQCALCHTAEPGDNGGAQGPGLHGIFGKRAASNPAFSYTPALRGSNLVWDAASLDRFLAAPTTVVPGSSMVIPVAQKTDRENIVAYLQSVAASTAGSVAQAPAAATKGEADWKKDAPGRVHHIKASELPAPFDTPSARNFPKLVDRPTDAKLSLPPGFKAEVFARDLQGPRALRVAPNGDVFVSETQAGRVKVLRPSANAVTAASAETFADGLKQPFGMAFYPRGNDPQWIYVAEVNRVVRYPYRAGDMKARGGAEVVVPELSPVAGGHFTRDIVFSLDGKRMFVSVGSLSNVAEDMSKKSPADIQAWEAQHGVGAAWDKEINRAAVLVFDVGANKPGRIFATGIRNCVGLTMHPRTGDVWCTTNERDGLGDDLVPDYSTRVKEGGFYGWPWYYMGNYEDPRLKGDRPDLRGKAIVPDVLFTAHSAADNLLFYEANSGASAFPAEYVGEGFAVLHGSWNRSFRTGHKMVRIRMKNGVPTGEYADFLTGFIVDDGNAWARPVAAAQAKDGSVLMSDDGGNVIYRISYSR